MSTELPAPPYEHIVAELENHISKLNAILFLIDCALCESTNTDLVGLLTQFGEPRRAMDVADILEGLRDANQAT